MAFPGVTRILHTSHFFCCCCFLYFNIIGSLILNVKYLQFLHFLEGLMHLLINILWLFLSLLTLASSQIYPFRNQMFILNIHQQYPPFSFSSLHTELLNCFRSPAYTIWSDCSLIWVYLPNIPWMWEESTSLRICLHNLKTSNIFSTHL